METYAQQLANMFRNVILNAAGVERNFLQLIEDEDIDKAIDLMQDRHEEVDEAIKEYNPQTHEVMRRKDKARKNDKPYVVEKLPRTRQRYINEVELFFLLGAPLKYKKINGEDRSYSAFTDFIKKNRMDSVHRQFKRLAGAETEAAIVFHLYTEKEEIICKPFIAARSTGYDIRPLFDQYGTMLAFAYGYKEKTTKGSKQVWEILTESFIVKATKEGTLWDVERRENILGKIPVVYAHQQKAWDGAEKRLHREEMMDSKVGDTNNYFADPIAYATADVVKLMSAGDAERVGRLVQYAGKDSQFGYVNPPQNSESRRDEQAMLAQSILFDTFTPDFSYDSIKGMGTLSGEAMENAMILGFIKRANRIETYGELFDREVNVIKAVLKVMQPTLPMDSLDVEVEFQSPFTKQNTSLWTAIGGLYQSGVCSLDTAVNLLALTDAPEEEIARITAAAEQNAKLAAQAKGIDASIAGPKE